jgi:hypothetical protein
MIIVRLLGGLGNQMFQYAMGRSLQLRKQQEVVFDVSKFHLAPGRKYMLHNFDIPIVIGKSVDIIETIKEKDSFKFDPEVYAIEGGHYYLEGSWQNPDYFRGIWQIKDELCGLKERPSPLCRYQMGDISTRRNPVAIHVRCGDYFNESTSKFHGNLPVEYYERALEMVSRELHIADPEFYVFSDDIKEACKVLPAQYKYRFIDDTIPDYEQIIIMSKCKHFIIANSSFSWWGAYLADNQYKQVIAPERWIVPKHHVGIHPDRWIRLGGFV